ncbi:MAG: hypothetical protein R3F65_22710 [bacterium]
MKASTTVEAELFELAAMAALCLWEPRPELQRLCRAAGAGPLDAAAIDALVPGLSARARENLRRHAIELGLVDAGGVLTGRGRRCAESGQAPVQELGVYGFLVAMHPLIGTELLGFRRLKVDHRDHDLAGLVAFPRGFDLGRGRVFEAVVGGRDVFGVDEFPAPRGQAPSCRCRPLPPARLDWEIDLWTGENRLTLSGQAGREWGVFAMNPAPIDPGELVDLFSGWEPRWDPDKRWLAMDYDDVVGADGNETFRREWSCPDLPIGRHGPFAEVTVDDVPVGPRDVAEARRWATAIAIGRLRVADGYLAPGAWPRRWQEAIAGTPLAGAGAAPEAAAVTHVDGRPLPARARWLLVAGADLEAMP